VGKVPLLWMALASPFTPRIATLPSFSMRVPMPSLTAYLGGTPVFTLVLRACSVAAGQ
jgi:hypothetical protein